GPFAGLLDEIAIYNRALAPGEIGAIFTAGPSGKCRTSPSADLVLRSVTGPPNLAPGQPAALTYTLANEGPTPVTGAWTDAVFLSHDTNIGLDFLVDTFVVTNTVPPGATVTFTRQIVVPNNGPSGKLFFVVAIDAG